MWKLGFLCFFSEKKHPWKLSATSSAILGNPWPITAQSGELQPGKVPKILFHETFKDYIKQEHMNLKTYIPNFPGNVSDFENYVFLFASSDEWCLI